MPDSKKFTYAQDELTRLSMMHSTRIGQQKQQSVAQQSAYIEKIDMLLKRHLAYRSKGRLEEAIKTLDQVLGLAPENAQALFSKCQILFEQKRFERLLFELSRFDGRKLRNPVFSYLVGLNYYNLTRYDMALVYLFQAIDLDPSYAIARLLVAQIYADIDKPEKGLQALPDLTAETLGTAKETITHASILSRMGCYDQSLSVLRCLLRDREVSAEVIQEIVKLPHRYWPDDLGADIETHLSRTQTSSEDLRRLHFAAGRLADQRGNFDKAFSHFEQANRLSNLNFDAAGLRDCVSTLLEVFGPGFRYPPAEPRPDQVTPVFIVGLPRTGKTLLESELRRHPDIAAAGERDLRMFIDDDIFVDCAGEAVSNLKPKVKGLSEVKRRHYSSGYIEEVLSSLMVEVAPKCLTNTLPLNFWNAGAIRCIFPNAKFINMRRNRMDVCVENYMKNFMNDYSFASNQEWLGIYHESCRTICEHWRKMFEDQWLDVRYESLVSDPVTTLGLAFDFLGVDSRKISGPVDVNGSGISNEFIGRWQCYEEHLQPLLEVFRTSGAKG